MEGRRRLPAAGRHPAVPAQWAARREPGEGPRMTEPKPPAQAGEPAGATKAGATKAAVTPGSSSRRFGWDRGLLARRLTALPTPVKWLLVALLVVLLYALPLLEIPIISTPDTDFGAV